MTTAPAEVSLGTNASIPLATYNTTVLNKARFEQESLAGTNNPIVGVDSLPNFSRNFLVNGGFEDWSNPLNVNFADIVYDNPSYVTPVTGPDGWGIIGGKARTLFYGDTNQGHGAIFNAYASAGSTFYQSSYAVGELRGRVATFRIRFLGGPMHLVIGDDTGAGATGATIDGTDFRWRTAVISYTVAATATRVTCSVVVDPGEFVYLDSGSLVAASGPVAYQPNPALQLVGEQHKVAVYTISHRWYTTSANEKSQIHINFRGSPIPTALVPTTASLNANHIAPGNPPTTDANIDWPNTLVLSCDVSGMVLQIGSFAANTSTYVYGLKILFVSPVF